MDSVLNPPSPLPPLPLLLWEAPPGLELILAQEGVPFVRVRDPHPLALRAGRFVVFDGRKVAPARVRGMLTPGHVSVDMESLRRAEGSDPFADLVDNRAGRMAWKLGGGLEVAERVARRDKAALRRRVVARLREAIERAGGLWARLATYPFPYRSAFNFRADLDEPYPDDYARFARARRPIDDCTTHFLSTHAYGGDARVLGDLRGRDVQSHGHFHVIYRSPEANRRNVERAHATLASAGFVAEGFAAPEGRWNPGLDGALEGMGYLYSSDFHLGFDDLPFYPWLGGRFSGVLQVPIHPICEGLFPGTSAGDGRAAGEHLIRAVRAKVDAGEPAFVYGHPERRLGRFPGVVRALAREVEGQDLLWRTTLTEFARWWRWRSARRWSVVPKGPGRFEVQFDEWDARYPLALEVHRGEHVASLPVTGPCQPLGLDGLAYERRPSRADLPAPRAARGPLGLRSLVRAALDWETVTPIEDLPTGSVAARLKVGLRRWRARPRASAQDREGQACA